MPDIVHDLVIQVPVDRVFRAVSTAPGLDWAMYLRVLKRHLEHGESVPYERRLDV
jgi:hypothetical protein